MKADTRSFYQRAVQSTIDRITGDLDQALDLHELARDACLSPFHFHRVFQGMVGETPLELNRRLRMERAAWQLFNSSSSVTAIAFTAGYETHEAFTRAFRAAYSTSPTGFRQRAFPRIELTARCGVHFIPDGRLQQFIPRDSGGKEMQVEIKDMPAMRLATVEHKGPYNQVGNAFARLGQLAGPAGLMQHASAMIGLYHDDPETTPQDELRSHAALVVPEAVSLPEGLVEMRIGAGRYACTMHKGPYELLGDSWSRLMGEWIPASGNRVRDSASIEIYHNTMETAKPEELLTEICVPVEARG